MRVQTQYILIDVFPGGRWITTVSGIFIYIVAISRALVEPPEVRIIRSSADVHGGGGELDARAQLSTSIFIFRLINPESRHVPIPPGDARTRPPFFLPLLGRPRQARGKPRDGVS